MDWVTTTTILEHLRDFDDNAAWGRLHERFRGPILNFARRMGLSETAAEDVAQETLLAFMEAYRNGKYDRSKGRLSSWLFGIAYRQAAGARRKRAKEAQKQIEAGQDESVWKAIPSAEEATSVWDKEWERAAIEKGLAQIRGEVTEQTYRAFELVTRAGRSADEVARELNMTRDAVYVAKHRVLKRLGEWIKAYDQVDDS